MYLTDIRGFSSKSDIYLYLFTRAEMPVMLGRMLEANGRLEALSLAGDCLIVGTACELEAERKRIFSKITIHGMGILGDKGISHHFAQFCRLYSVSPFLTAFSDMGISFFVPESERVRILDALCEYFPMWA